MNGAINVENLIRSAAQSGRPCEKCDAELRHVPDREDPRVTLLVVSHDPGCPVIAAHYSRPNRAQRRAARRGRR